MSDQPDLRTLYEDVIPPAGSRERLRARLTEPDLYETTVWVFTHRVAAGIAAAWLLVGFLHMRPAEPAAEPDVASWISTDTSLETIPIDPLQD